MGRELDLVFCRNLKTPMVPSVNVFGKVLFGFCFKKMFGRDIKVKTVSNILYLKLFVNIFVLKRKSFNKQS